MVTIRLKYIDFIKGLAIVLVILGHVIQNIDIDYDNNICFRYIYSFHMPLFMFISGFVSYQPALKFSSLKKRTLQLLVPFFVWPLFYDFYKGTWSLYDTYKALILNPETGLWFLWVLFFISVILIPISRLHIKYICNQNLVIFFSAILLFFIIGYLNTEYFGLKLIALYYIYYCSGFLARMNIKYLQPIIEKMSWILTIAFCFFAYFWMRKEPPTFMSSASYFVKIIYRFFVAYLGIAATMGMSMRYIVNGKNSIVIDNFAKFGKVTLGIYAFQYIAISICQSLVPNILALNFRMGIVFILACLLSYSGVMVLRRFKLTSLLLLGINNYANRLNNDIKN